MKFPQGEGSAVIHRKKNRPALPRHDIWTVCVCFFFSFSFFSIENLLSSSSTHFLVVEFFIACYTAPFCSKHFFLGLFVRLLSAQLFFSVVCSFYYLVWLLSVMEGPFLSSECHFFTLLTWAIYNPALFLRGCLLSSLQSSDPFTCYLFSARACSLAFLSSVSPFLTICRAVFIYLILFSGLF